MRIDRSRIAVRRQLDAMGGARFEIGVRNQQTGQTLIRQWSKAEVENSLGWLKSKNATGCHVYVRHQGSQGLLLLDDVGIGTLDRMKDDGVEPALVVETSPTNFQAWVRVSDRPLREDEATQIARALARRYGADPNSADFRHFGRLAGFTNPKPQYVRGNGQFPFVLLREAKGTIASHAARLREEARQLLGQKPRQGGAGEVFVVSGTDRDPIEVFRELSDRLLETYGQAADCSRVDWMVTSEMLHRGFTAERIKAAMREASPKLRERKKGHVDDYINRSVDKAFEQFRQSAQGDRNMTDKAWEKKRKARTHQLIQVGGLADIAGLIDTDPGALLGGLLLIADALQDETTFHAYKRHGDAILQQRAQARQANKKVARES